MKVYSSLLDFLKAHGNDLSAYGTEEAALRLEDALEFLDLLQVNAVPLLGIEVWRSTATGFDCNGLEVWYPALEGTAANHADGRNYLLNLGAALEDRFTIQF